MLDLLAVQVLVLSTFTSYLDPIKDLHVIGLETGNSYLQYAQYPFNFWPLYEIEVDHIRPTIADLLLNLDAAQRRVLAKWEVNDLAVQTVLDRTGLQGGGARWKLEEVGIVLELLALGTCMRNLEIFSKKVVREVRPGLFEELEGTVPGFKMVVDGEGPVENGGGTGDAFCYWLRVLSRLLS